MSQVCRTCLQEITVLNYKSLADAISLTETRKIKDILLTCVPVLDLDVIADPVMCEACITSLHISYDFKRKCLRTEERIRNYVHSLVFGTKDVDIMAMVCKDKKNDEEIEVKEERLEANQFEIHVKEEPCEESLEDKNNCPIKELNTENVLYSHIYSNSEAVSDQILVSSNLNHNPVLLVPTLESPSNQFQCSICKKIFVLRSSLYSHIKIHNTERPFKCTKCDYSTKQHVNLKTHMRIHSGEKPYECSVCHFRTVHHSSITHHMKIHTGNNTYQCNNCDYSSSLKACLILHMEIHHTQPFKCNECGFQTNQEDSLLVHIKSHTNTQKKCPKCDFVAENQDLLKTHLNNHRKQNFTSHNKNKHKIHVKSHTIIKKPYKCTECEYTATCRMHIIKHMRTHTGKKPFKCDLCDFTASHSFSLRRHMTVHSDEKPFKCTICSYMAKRKTYLLDHIRTHTGEKPYKCCKCNYSTSRRSSLVSHLMKVHERPPIDVNPHCSDDENFLNPETSTGDTGEIK